jgi:ribosomal protein S18 acetylase RimI-like enzyme
MIHFKRFKTVDCSEFKDINELYEFSFPHHERRNRNAFEHLTMNEEAFVCNAIYDDNVFVGFINCWKLNGFLFVEHFAIKSEFRDRKLGVSTMKYLMQMTDEPIVLEVEMPKSNDASRRIHFYERLGFFVLSDFYMQPPYHPNDFPTPMLIMSNNYQFCKKHFHSIKEKIYKNVYHFETA